MSDDFTDSLLLRQPEVNANQNLWGGLLNESFGSALLDDAIVGAASYALSGPKTLSRANGEEDEARRRVQYITGGTGGTVTIPSVPIWYWFINNASGPVTVTNGSVSVVVPAGSSTAVFSPDGAALVVGLTKAYVDAKAFNVALPEQTGNAGKFVKTDGTTASWDLVDLAANVKGVLPVSSGGTGGVLPLSNGGTGVTSLAALKAAVSGWTQIGNPVNATGLATVTVSGVPSNYSDVMVLIGGVSRGNTFSSLGFSLSENGTNFSNTGSISMSNSGDYYGALFIPGHRLQKGVLSFSAAQLAARDITSASGSDTYSWRLPGDLAAVRFTLTSGDALFTAGIFTLYAR